MVRRSAIQEELEVELLPRVEWSQMRWLRHRVRTLPGEVFMARPSGRTTLGRPRTRLGGTVPLYWPGNTSGSPRRSWTSDWGEGSLGWASLLRPLQT